MNIRFFAFAALMTMGSAAFGQNFNDRGDYDRNNADTAFQVRYASNLLVGDSVINLTNTGASSRDAFTTPDGPQDGNLCVNVYAYTPDEQLAACCSCFVTPNGLNSLSVKNDLASNPLTPVVPSSMVIKLVASKAGASASTCNPATVKMDDLRDGLAAWGTTIHPLPVTPGSPATTYALGETAFTTSYLSRAEHYRMTQLCAFIRGNGSGYGICKSCKLGGLGAAAK